MASHDRRIGGRRHSQHRRTHRQKPAHRIGHEHRGGKMGGKRGHHAGMLQNAHHAQDRDHREIDQHDRAEKGRNLGRAPALDQEQADQDHHHHRHDRAMHPRFVNGQTLDRAHYRNGGRNHRIAIKQRGGKHAQQHDARRPALARNMLVDQSQQGQRTALAPVVRAHDDRDIFQRHNHHHRPEHQADDAVNMQLIERQAVMTGKSVAHRVKRAGADIAKHHAHRPQRQLGQAAMRSVMIGRVFDLIGLARLRHWLHHAYAPESPRKAARPGD